jgi:hypothetical protein
VLLSDHRLDHPGDRGGKNLLKAPARFAAQEFRPGKGLGPDRRILRQGRKFLVGCFGRPSRLVPKHRPLPCFYRPLKRIDFHRARYSMGTSSFCQGTRKLRVRTSTRASTALTHQKRAFGPPWNILCSNHTKQWRVSCRISILLPPLRIARRCSCQKSSSSKTRLKDECPSASLMRRVVSMNASASLKQAWSCRSQNNPAASSLGPIRRR